MKRESGKSLVNGQSGAAPATVSGECWRKTHWCVVQGFLYAAGKGRWKLGTASQETGRLFCNSKRCRADGGENLVTDTTGHRATFVFGGARSGKSEFAEQLANTSGLQKFYIATSAVFDPEMSERIGQHRHRRGASWTTIEEQIDLAGVLEKTLAPDRVVLVDCLTLWLSNLTYTEKRTEAEIKRLLSVLSAPAGPCIFVSNEVGMGIVPENKLSRSFRDAQGRLNQDMATVCDQVVFVAAGQPLLLKPNSQPDIGL